MSPFAPKLGRLKGTPDPRTLRLDRYLDYAALPTPPASIDWYSGITNWGVMLNDTYGDCVVAAAGHHVQAWTFRTTGSAFTVPDATIKQTYFGLTGGYDSGLDPLVMCKFMQKTGMAGHKLLGYAQFEPADRVTLDACLFGFGGAYVAVQLPGGWQPEPDGVWEVTGRPDPSAGHMMALLGRDAKYDYYLTWGAVQRTTRAWTAKYADQAFALLSPDWLKAGTAPSGIDMASLWADIQSLGGDPGPAPQPQPQPPPVPSDGGWGDLF